MDDGHIDINPLMYTEFDLANLKRVVLHERVTTTSTKLARTITTGVRLFGPCWPKWAVPVMHR